MKDVFGVEIQVGNWFLHASPNTMPIRLHWGIVVEETSAGKLKYAEVYLNYDRSGNPVEAVVDYKVSNCQVTSNGPFSELEVHIRVLKRAGASCLVIPEASVPQMVLDAWHSANEELQRGTN